jgi:hypothetical protein
MLCGGHECITAAKTTLAYRYGKVESEEFDVVVLANLLRSREMFVCSSLRRFVFAAHVISNREQKD